MSTQAIINQTESWTQQELAAQTGLLELLAAQEQAIAEGSTAGITHHGERIQAHLRSGPVRERQRLQLMHRFGRAWNVSADTLSLRSISERAQADGLDTTRLDRIREDLRATVAQVLKKGRRLATMARYHQGLLSEILGVLLDNGAALPAGAAREPSS